MYMRSTFKGQMKQESFFLQITQFCTVTFLMHFSFSLNAKAAPDVKLPSGLIWKQNNLKPLANSANALQLSQLEEDIWMKEIFQENIGTKAARMGLGLMEVPKGAGRSMSGYPTKSLFSKGLIEEGGTQWLWEGWTLAPWGNAVGFLHLSCCFLSSSRMAGTAFVGKESKLVKWAFTSRAE